MSWPERSLLALSLALALGGCQVRPLYGTFSVTVSVEEGLRAVAVPPVAERVGQELRNRLIYALHGGSALPPRYQLDFVLTESDADLGLERAADIPAARLVSLSATFALTDLATGATLASGTSIATSSYDFSTQRFANLRAERDAEDRAAGVLADDIRTRVAAALATGG